MDEYLSEKEQIERIRTWWRENGWYLIGGAALGALALFGWNQYQAYQMRRAEEAGTLYQSLAAAVEDDDETRATELLEQLRAEHPSSAYADQAGLLVAKLRQQSADTEGAVRELRYVMENSRDPDLALIARLRLARLLAYRQQYEEALALLREVDPGQFAGRFSEVEGDIHYAQGNLDAARSAYLEALNAPGSQVLDRNLLQMKLNELESAAGDDAEAA
ncbi:MAG TPA: tetratricopeptide repeat protein [Gammaproteobacteria bacterium]